MHQFSPDEIRHIAHLARLSVSDADLKKFPEQLTNIVQFVSSLQKVKTDGTQAIPYESDAVSLLRDDVVDETNAAERVTMADGGVSVPSVFKTP